MVMMMRRRLLPRIKSNADRSLLGGGEKRRGGEGIYIYHFKNRHVNLYVYHHVVVFDLLYKRGKDGERLGKNFSLGCPPLL